MSRKEFLYNQERRLIDELDTLADQAISDKFRYKKQRLDSVQSELNQVTAAELKEREHVMAKELKDKEIVLKDKEIQLQNKKNEFKNKELEIKKIESETKELEVSVVESTKTADLSIAVANMLAGCIDF